MSQIKNKWNNNVIIEDKNLSIKELIEKAIRENMNLYGAYLSEADLSGADLSGAYLSGADLFRADLSGADLSGADLSGANLSRANLSRANLFRADLSRADLSGANLSRANLFRADLSGADLSGADLFRADLSGADLSGANLSRANLSEANLPNFLIIPEEGEFICYKKVFDNNKNSIILTLKIPNEARRISTLMGRKCRVSCAIPIKAEDVNGNIIENEIIFQNLNSQYPFIWEMNKENFPSDGYDDDIRIECTKGLHVFITKKEALEFHM